MSKKAALKILNTATKTISKGFRLEDVLFTGIIRTKAKMPVPSYEKVKHGTNTKISSFCQ